MARESTSVTTGTPCIDVLIGGRMTIGTSSTEGEQFDFGVSASHDASTLEERNFGIKLLASTIVNGPSNMEYEVAPRSLAALYGGVLPEVFECHARCRRTVHQRRPYGL